MREITNGQKQKSQVASAPLSVARARQETPIVGYRRERTQTSWGVGITKKQCPRQTGKSVHLCRTGMAGRASRGGGGGERNWGAKKPRRQTKKGRYFPRSKKIQETQTYGDWRSSMAKGKREKCTRALKKSQGGKKKIKTCPGISLSNAEVLHCRKGEGKDAVTRKKKV